MNSRQHELRLTVELRQVSETVQCIFHSLLLHRTLAKVRVNSSELSMCVDEDIRQFRSEIEDASYSGSAPRRTPSVGSPTESAVPLLSAQIGLDFYQKQRRQSMGWFGGGDDMNAWEQWKLILDVFQVDSFDELQKMRQTVADKIGEMVLDICEQINRPMYIPKMPLKAELGDVFDCRFSDCQPYLFKIYRKAVPTIPIKPSFTQATFQRWKDVFL